MGGPPSLGGVHCAPIWGGSSQALSVSRPAQGSWRGWEQRRWAWHPPLSVRRSRWSLSKRPPEPCVALTPAPWERSRRPVPHGSLSSPNLQRAAQNRTMGKLGAGGVRGVHIKQGQRKAGGDRERGRGRGSAPSLSPPRPTLHHSARLSRAVNPGVRQKSPWGFVGPVTGSLCHPRTPCWIPYGQLG